MDILDRLERAVALGAGRRDLERVWDFPGRENIRKKIDRASRLGKHTSTTNHIVRSLRRFWLDQSLSPGDSPLPRFIIEDSVVPRPNGESAYILRSASTANTDRAQYIWYPEYGVAVAHSNAYTDAALQEALFPDSDEEMPDMMNSASQYVQPSLIVHLHSVYRQDSPALHDLPDHPRVQLPQIPHNQRINMEPSSPAPVPVAEQLRPDPEEVRRVMRELLMLYFETDDLQHAYSLAQWYQININSFYPMAQSFLEAKREAEGTNLRVPTRNVYRPTYSVDPTLWTRYKRDSSFRRDLLQQLLVQAGIPHATWHTSSQHRSARRMGRGEREVAEIATPAYDHTKDPEWQAFQRRLASAAEVPLAQRVSHPDPLLHRVEPPPLSLRVVRSSYNGAKRELGVRYYSSTMYKVG